MFTGPGEIDIASEKLTMAINSDIRFLAALSRWAVGAR